MSCRQAVSVSSKRTPTVRPNATDAVTLVRNGRDLPGPQRFKKGSRCRGIESRIDGLNAEKEPVVARQREAWHVEHGVIRHGEAVQREHAEDRRQRGPETRALER